MLTEENQLLEKQIVALMKDGKDSDHTLGKDSDHTPGKDSDHTPGHPPQQTTLSLVELRGDRSLDHCTNALYVSCEGKSERLLVKEMRYPIGRRQTRQVALSTTKLCSEGVSLSYSAQSLRGMQKKCGVAP
ncbi:hypothetical protein OIU85_029170 [Salix viminalis]|uniref:Uncharacterized protein n=1 Tax=Salix viminalis TaxID=40686 RepID=A0A9Q0T7A7_SALVM|nr:hypothetical protein OIU85_029170 [Salix viminalis]